MIGFLWPPFKETLKKMFCYLFQSIGMLLGIGLFSYPIEYLLENYQVFLYYGASRELFGTVPSLLKENQLKNLTDKIDLTWLCGQPLISGD